MTTFLLSDCSQKHFKNNLVFFNNRNFPGISIMKKNYFVYFQVLYMQILFFILYSLSGNS